MFPSKKIVKSLSEKMLTSKCYKWQLLVNGFESMGEQLSSIEMKYFSSQLCSKYLSGICYEPGRLCSLHLEYRSEKNLSNLFLQRSQPLKPSM